MREWHLPSESRGFTILELITVILIVGVLAITAVPRLSGRSGFDSRGFYDRAAAVVRAAQKTAVAWRGNVFVCVTATQLTAGTTNTCVTQLAGPSGNLSFAAPSGVTLNAVTFGFDGLGRPVNSAGTILAAATTITLTSTIAGDPARQIVVQPQTGYVVAN